MEKIENIFEAIKRERRWQDNKWGDLEEHPHTVGEWLLIMESELTEAKTGWVRNGGDNKALEEILQVISVGFACLEQHGIQERAAIKYAEKCKSCGKLERGTCNDEDGRMCYAGHLWEPKANV